MFYETSVQIGGKSGIIGFIRAFDYVHEKDFHIEK